MDDGYGAGFGNRIANARALGEKWLETAREPAGASGVTAASAPAPRLCCEQGRGT